MSLQPEVDNSFDDWGDFDAAISDLCNDEKAEEKESSAEDKPLATQDKVDNTEAIQSLLEVVFMVVEKGTAIFTGVDFKFDVEGKQEVTRAAVPVLTKHGAVVSGVFGNYIEEATLLLAVFGLIYTTRHNLKTLKAEKRKQQEAANDEETPIAQAA